MLWLKTAERFQLPWFAGITVLMNHSIYWWTWSRMNTKKPILKGGNSSKNQNIKLWRPNRSGRGDRSTAVWLRNSSSHDQCSPGPPGAGGSGAARSQRHRRPGECEGLHSPVSPGTEDVCKHLKMLCVFRTRNFWKPQQHIYAVSRHMQNGN